MNKETSTTLEQILNKRLAQLLSLEGLGAEEEQSCKSENKRHQVDVLVELEGVAVAIEAEYAPNDGKKDALSRIVDPPLTWKGLPIKKVYALQYPQRLQKMPSSQAFDELAKTNDLQCYQWDAEKNDWKYVGDSVASIAQALRHYWLQTDEGDKINETVKKVSHAIKEASDILGGKESEGDTKSLVWLNALLFQELLAKNLTLPPKYSPSRIPRPNPAGDTSDLLRQWNEILEINWHPIFSAARDALEQSSPEKAKEALNYLKRIATEIAEQGFIQRHDITGRIYHRLLEERKFLATNYTTIPAAILLAGLTFDKKHTWAKQFDFASPETLAQMKIIDPACGSGTLLMAVLQEMIKCHRESVDEYKEEEKRKAIKIMLEKTIYGFDVVAGAIHFAASTLSMSETSQFISEMQLYRTEYGFQNGTAKLGSIDMLESSPSKGHATRRNIFDAIHDTVIRAGTKGDEIKEAFEFPRADLVIANPPYTRAGGPGDADNTAWNPIFGGTMSEKDQKIMHDTLNKTLQPTPASMLAGLASAFLVLADQKIKLDGRLSFVLPATLVTGKAWEKMRQFILRRYEIDWIITSHDPKIRSAKKGFPGRKYVGFSESTSLAEVLLVATRRKKPNSTHSIAFVNLRRNLTHSIDALSLLRTLSAFSDKDPLDNEIRIDGKTWGELRYVEQGTLESGPWPENAFVQARLYPIASALRNEHTFKGRHIPLVPLDQNFSIGPYHLNIKGKNQGLFQIDKDVDRLRTGYPVLWHHDAKHQGKLEVEPNAWIRPRKGISKEKLCAMLAKASRLQIALEMWFPTQETSAVLTDDPMLGVRGWLSLLPKEEKAREGVEEVMCLWFNSSMGLLLRHAHATRPYAGRSVLTNSYVRTHKALDVSVLTNKQLKRAKAVYERLKTKELCPVYQLDKDPVRAEIDAMIEELLELPIGALREVAELLAREPSIHGGKREALS